MAIFKKLLRSGEGKKLKALSGLVPEINALESDMQRLSDDQLRHKTVEFRQRLDNGSHLDDILLEAFAVVRETATRTIGQRHYDVQLMGGAALHFGWVAEMKTGEGKTITSTLPVYLNGLTNDGVHVVTVNEYLATRDAEWMSQIHGWLGLTTGLVTPTSSRNAAHKREQYACDVTYGTNNEFGFDYLRDNMAMQPEARVQRGHNFCIVDEIDSILIDEARTPLIISGRLADAAQIYYQFASIVRGLTRDLHYDVDEEKRIVAITEEGIHAVERSLGIDNLYDAVQANYVHQLQAALKAKELFQRDKDYIVADGEVSIVDEFTGRVLEGRRWSEGLHQAVEAKEGAKIKEENQTLATITLQNYFRLYDRLCGMTGTAETEAAELFSTYGLHVVPVPTNLPLIRKDEVDLVFKTENGKFNSLVADIKQRHEVGQPVLVGTISVEKSEKLSKALAENSIPHEVLNAKQHTREAEIVAQAGRLHSVTVATNMAGRGVDIILGGNPEALAERDARAEGLEEDSEEYAARVAELEKKYSVDTVAEGDVVRELGGLYVLATERHDSRRIDNQLRGRAGRQGDPGESRFYLSLEDELMRIFATGTMQWVMDKALDENVPIDSKMVTKAVERAQTTVEQKNAEARKNVLKYDEVMNEQRKVIYVRRAQILDGADLRDEAIEYLSQAVDSTIGNHSESDVPAEWDLEPLLADVQGLWPSDLTTKDLAAPATTDALYDALMANAMVFYEDREAEIGEAAMREIERQVMLRILDTKWREHLYDMDYLKVGIGLRAMGQKDPLIEWQREGFEMFTEMMNSAARDFVTYVMHVQVKVEDPADDVNGDGVRDESVLNRQAQSPTTTGVTESGPASPAEESAAAKARFANDQKVIKATEQAPKTVEANQAGPQAPVIKSQEEKIGRNDPCHCGSGKKFKQCHGRG